MGSYVLDLNPGSKSSKYTCFEEPENLGFSGPDWLRDIKKL
jgi:hypothetical protein